MTAWAPKIRDGDAPLYRRIADTIERDIASGRLSPGAQLPPHRDLALLLGLSVGTVTKAYGEAMARGLLTGHVGRGSFVKGVAAGPGEAVIDLARNLPAGAADFRHVADAVARLRRWPDPSQALAYGPPEGPEAGRLAAVHWLRRRHGVQQVEADDLIQTAGGQHGLALALAAFCRRGDTVLCEAATFHGTRALAEFAGYRLHGVTMDKGGISVAALERAVAETGARVLCLIPTLHNPTATTLSASRRRQIAALARKHDLILVEDDAYGAVAGLGEDLPTLVDLAPERTVHVCALSKSVSPGLRLGFLKVPDAEARAGVLRAVRASNYTPPGLNALIFAQWVEDGTADAITDHVVGEARRRTEVARRVLGPAMVAPGAPQSLHVWLPMPALEAERTAGRALRAGVEVTPPDAPIVDGSLISGLRVCLGNAADLTQLEAALGILARARAGEVSEQARAVV